MNIKRQNGAVLFVSLIMLSMLSLMAMSSIQSSTLELNMARNLQHGITAFNNAETGIAVSMAELNANYDLPVDGFDGVINGQYRSSDTFYDTILIDDDTDGDGDPTTDSNNMVRLISQGTSFDNALRTIEVRLSIRPGINGFALDKAILVNGDITFGGDAELNGSNQDIHSNGDIFRANRITTSGTVSASGEVYGLPAGESNALYIEIPMIAPYLYAKYADYTFDSNGKVYNAGGTVVATDSYNGWVFNGSKWRTLGANVLGGLLYFKGDAGNVDIRSNTGSIADPWMISILADGWISVSGTPVYGNYKNPLNPLAVQEILFMAGTDIKILGHPNHVISGIIAAGEQFSLSGTAQIEGTIIAADQSDTSDLVRENYMSGTANVTNDGSFSLPPVLGGNVFEILSWRTLVMGQAEFANL